MHISKIGQGIIRFLSKDIFNSTAAPQLSHDSPNPVNSTPMNRILLFSIITKEPLHYIPKHTLRPCLDHVPMARNQPIKIPLINPPNRLLISLAISYCKMPYEPFLPRRWRSRRHQRRYDSRQYPRRGRYARFRILFCCREVEKQVSFDQGTATLVQKDQFPRYMAVDVFRLEFRVEFF